MRGMKESAPSDKQRRSRFVFGTGVLSLLVVTILVLVLRIGTGSALPELPHSIDKATDVTDPLAPASARESLPVTATDRAAASTIPIPDHALRVRISGRVLGELNRQPIAGAAISVVQNSSAWDPPDWVFQDTSQADGTFELEFWIGTWRVAIVAEHPEHLTSSRTLRNGEIPGDGQLVGFDLVLAKRSAGAALTGVVQNDRGRKLAGAEVELKLRGLRGADTLLAPLRSTADEHGRFTFRDVPPARWVLTARAPAYEDYVLAPLDLGPETETDLGVLLINPFPWARIAGTVRNAQGEAISGLPVHASGIGNPPRTSLTGEGGAYLVERLAPAEVFVTLDVGDGLSLRRRITLSAGEFRKLDFAMPDAKHFVGGVAYIGEEPAAGWTAYTTDPEELPDGSAPSWTTQLDEQGRFLIEGLSGPVKLGFRREVPYTYRDVGVVALDRDDHVFRLPAMHSTSTLRGTVRDPDGVPLADVRVAPLVPTSAQERAVTATDGRYELRVRMSNDSTFPIFARKNGYVSSSISTMENAADAEGIIRLDFVLYPDAWTGVAAGYVRDPQGRPISGAECYLRLGGLRSAGSAHTDSRGYYEIQGVLPGQLQLRVRHDRYRTQMVEQELVPGTRLDLDVQLEPWRVHTRQFEVYGEGNPLAGASVRVSSSSRGFMIVDRGTTGPRGSVTLTRVPNESVRVVVEHPDYPQHRAELVVEDDLVTAFQVHLKRGDGQIHGIAHSASGVPRRDVEIHLTGPVIDRAQIWHHEYTDEEGRFRFTGLPSAEYAIMAWTIAGEIEQQARVNGPRVEFVVR